MAELVAEQAGGARHPGQGAVRVGVRHQADLPDRLQALDRDEILEHVDRVLGAGQPDPLAHSGGQAVDVDVLAADDARWVAVEETNEADAVLPRPGDDLVDGHRHLPLIRAPRLDGRFCTVGL